MREHTEKVKSMKETGPRADAVWVDFSQRWYTVMHSTGLGFLEITRRLQSIYETSSSFLLTASALEGVSDITVASGLIGDKDSTDYGRIIKYLKKAYEPVKVGNIEYGVTVDDIFVVEPNACPSYEDIIKMPNKVLVWCGSRSSNLLRHLQNGFSSAIWIAVDRLKGFLVLAIASLGDEIAKLKKTKSLEEKKLGVKESWEERKQMNQSTFCLEDDIKVPSGRIVASENNDSPLDYNEHTVYNPNEYAVRPSYLMGVKYEKGVVMDTAE
ncbi:hypothetical protein L6164_022107 [Bauhinia variegata]|uniref:Uncharacterized protein n=1 Tax=Bauhinia variegata TaxID=167791 RepID=A0ACB9MDX8_BAUVA|nr:hypothetical protein L6164_022107 [Bauhinia variegata]